MRRRCFLAAPVLVSLALQGCSVLSPAPLWEVVKATGALVAVAGQSQPGEASHTVVHAHAGFQRLCIEFNPSTQAPDVVPALQAALSRRGVDSRVYDGAGGAAACPVWLRYSAQMQWGQTWMSDEPRAYLSAAVLTLHGARGEVLASSQYVLDPATRSSQWASTHDKLNAVVGALVQRATPAHLTTDPNPSL